MYIPSRLSQSTRLSSLNHTAHSYWLSILQVWVSFFRGHCSFLLDPNAQKVLFVPSKSLFPQSCVSSVIKSHWLQKSNSLGVLSPFARSPGGENCGIQNIHNSVRTSLVLLFSSLLVTHPAGMGFDFIVIVPLLLSCCGFFFVFEHGASFFGGFQ